jgi:hypothetical protein
VSDQCVRLVKEGWFQAQAEPAGTSTLRNPKARRWQRSRCCVPFPLAAHCCLSARRKRQCRVWVPACPPLAFADSPLPFPLSRIPRTPPPSSWLARTCQRCVCFFEARITSGLALGTPARPRATHSGRVAPRAGRGRPLYSSLFCFPCVPPPCGRAPQVDNDYFLVPVAVKDHEAPLENKFPVENRLLPQGGRRAPHTRSERDAPAPRCPCPARLAPRACPCCCCAPLNARASPPPPPPPPPNAPQAPRNSKRTCRRGGRPPTGPASPTSTSCCSWRGSPTWSRGRWVRWWMRRATTPPCPRASSSSSTQWRGCEAGLME